MYARQTLKAPCSQGYQWSEGGWCLLSFEAHFPSQQSPKRWCQPLQWEMSRMKLYFGKNLTTDLLWLYPFFSRLVRFFSRGTILSDGRLGGLGGQAWWGVGREGTWVVFVQNDSVDQGLIKTFVDYWLEQICEAREAYGPVHVRGLQTSGLTHSNVSFSPCFQTLYCVQTLDYLRHGYHKNTYCISESGNPPSVALSALQNL